MTKERNRLLNILDQMDKPAETPAPDVEKMADPSRDPVEAPTHIGQGRPRRHKRAVPSNEYKKITITITPEAYNLLVEEALRRKVALTPDATISGIIREMTFKYLGRSK